MQLAKDKLLFFRRKNKSTYAVNFKNNINYRSLQILLSKRQGIQIQNIVFIHHGKVLYSTFIYQNIQNKGIIHVIDLNQVKKEFVQVHFKYLDNRKKKFKVKSSEIIQEFIKNNLSTVDGIPYFYVGLIYVGKILSPTKTFCEEYVQNQCQIIIVDIKQYFSNQTKQKNQNKQLFQNPQKEVDGNHQVKADSSHQCSSKEENNNLLIQRENLIRNESNQSAKQTIGSQENKQIQDPPPFNIRISQVHSISTEQDQRNHVSFNQNYPFQTIPSSYQQHIDQFVPKASGIPKAQALGDSQLSMNDFIFIGSDYQNQTKSFIQRLMKKYRIVLQPKS